MGITAGALRDVDVKPDIQATMGNLPRPFRGRNKGKGVRTVRSFVRWPNERKRKKFPKNGTRYRASAKNDTALPKPVSASGTLRNGPRQRNPTRKANSQ